MSRQMRELKEIFYSRYGTYCWMCGKKYSKKMLTGHHWRVMKCHGGKVEESNIIILCCNCHAEINRIKFGTNEYWELMRQCLEWKNNHEKSKS